MLLALALIQAVVAAPDPAALALGRQVAETGTLASLLPMMAIKETEEMVAAYPELSAIEQAELRRIAATILTATMDRLLAAQARVYAGELSAADLRALVAFDASPAAVRHRAVQPKVIGASMAVVDGVDFKGDTMKAFCAKTGKGCVKAK